MTDQPMIEAERALIAHRWAVRVNLPTDLKHAAQLARRALDVAAYARLDAPQAVARAVEVLEGWAVAVDQRVKVEGGERRARTWTRRATSAAWSVASGSRNPTP